MSGEKNCTLFEFCLKKVDSTNHKYYVQAMVNYESIWEKNYKCTGTKNKEMGLPFS